MTRFDPSPEDWDRSLLATREFAMLAHDIKGALNGVLGGISLMDRGDVDPEMRLQMQRVSAAAQALASLVTDAVGVLPEGPMPAAVSGTSVDLAAFLRFLEQRWSGEAREKGLSFSLHHDPELPGRLLVDYLDLARVLGNLIGNAIKFSERGAIRLTVTMAEDGGIAFVLHDDGPGLGEGEVRQVFEYGYRQGGSAQPGHGLGLHIAKLLTERMGGTVSVANREAGGVEAVILLPRRLCVRNTADGGHGGKPSSEAGPPDLSGLRILLAEDNPTNQIVASQMLLAMNAEVTLACDGIEALERFEEAEVDLVVVDIEMPRKSGLDVIRAIRSRSDRRARIPIVALTAYAMQEHRTLIADAGANALISKPIVSIETFGRALAAHIRARAIEPVDIAAATDATAAEEPLIDRAIYGALVEAIGRDMLAELLDRIVADLEAARDALSGAIDPLDTGVIRANSHILVSVAGAFGAVRLQRRARELNAAAHAPSPPDLAGDVRSCIAEIGAAVGFAREQRFKC